jgi:hypothetical protein
VARACRPRASRAAACLAAALYLAVPAAADAHDPGLSLLDVRVEPRRISAALTLAVADATLVERDSGSLERFALESIALLLDGRRLTGVVDSRMADGEDGVRLTLSFERGAGSRLDVRSAAAARLARGHRQLLTARTGGGEILTQRMLDAASGGVEIDLGASGTGGRDRASAYGLLGAAAGMLGVLYWRRARKACASQPLEIQYR